MTIVYSYRVEPMNDGYAIERTHGAPADPSAFWTQIAGYASREEAYRALAEYEREEDVQRERFAEARKRFVVDPATREDIDAVLHACAELQRRGSRVARQLDPATWHKFMTMVAFAHDVAPWLQVEMAEMAAKE